LAQVDLVVLGTVEDLVDDFLDLDKQEFVGDLVLLLLLLLHFILMHVEEALQVPQRVVSRTFVDFSEHFALASRVNTFVVDQQLTSASFARRLRADVVAFVVDFDELPEEEVDTVLDELDGHFLCALLVGADHARHLDLSSVVDSWELVLFVAERTYEVKASN